MKGRGREVSEGGWKEDMEEKQEGEREDRQTEKILREESRLEGRK